MHYFIIMYLETRLLYKTVENRILSIVSMHLTVQIWIVLGAQPFQTFSKTANGQCLHESRERNVSISLSL